MMNMKKAMVLRVLWGFFLILPVLVFSGCDLYGKPGGDDTNEPGTLPLQLQGEWAFPPENPSEHYRIAADTVEYGYGGASPMDFTGAIRFVSNYSADSGVIIIEYTTLKPSYDKYNGLPFFAIYYQNLRADSVQLANATTFPDYSAPDTATLEEAKAKFTRGKMGSYVDWGVVQPQQRIKQ
jgi:hypothetical protein